MDEVDLIRIEHPLIGCEDRGMNGSSLHQTSVYLPKIFSRRERERERDFLPELEDLLLRLRSITLSINSLQEKKDLATETRRLIHRIGASTPLEKILCQ